MKLFHAESEPVSSGRDLDATAQLAIETGARLVRLVRRALRSDPPASISLSGLRTLAYLADSPGVCLSDVAEHLFVGNPTASKLVDDLVERGLLARAADTSDRRRLALTVTTEGRRVVATAARPAQEQIAELLTRLSAPDRKRVYAGLALLRDLLEPVERVAE